MCKLQSFKWAVVKSNKKISKSLTAKLSKIRFGFTEHNTFSFYYFDEQDFNKIVELLHRFKRQKFEVVRFTDKQFGLTVNHFSSSPSEFFNSQINNLPLSHKFSWFNNADRISITPITQKQFENIVRIN